MKLGHSLVCFVLILLSAGILLSQLDRNMGYVNQKAEAVSGDAAMQPRIIVIDAGHGGVDPGKVGVNGTYEKDINLEIALLLEKYFLTQNIQVIMTRRTDDGLYDLDSTNKKVDDMKKRVALIEECDADVLVSIHQNSYTDSRCRGAQVFYYTGSVESEALAKQVQQQLIQGVDSENTREAKANSDYYMLKNTQSLAIICECGFLSNPEECEKLSTDAYQRQIAWNIYIGVMQYLNEMV